MSEFCKTCSKELFDSEEHDEPCFSENCQKEKPMKEEQSKKTKILSGVVGVIAFGVCYILARQFFTIAFLFFFLLLCY